MERDKNVRLSRQQLAGRARMRKCRDHQSRAEMPDGRTGDQLEKDGQACDPTCTDDAARHSAWKEDRGARGKKHGEGDKEREFEMRETGMCQTEEEGGAWISALSIVTRDPPRIVLRETQGTAERDQRAALPWRLAELFFEKE